MKIQIHYAIIDEVKRIDDKFHIQLDSAPKSWIEENIFSSDNDVYFSNLKYIPSSYLMLQINIKEIKKIINYSNIYSLENRWVEVEFEYTKRAIGWKKITIYNDNATDGINGRIKNIKLLRRKDLDSIKKLKKGFDLKRIGNEANENDLKHCLQSLRKHVTKFVSVYNVGQGNSNALCDNKGEPLLYFDLGGGYGPNKKTYINTRSFCFRKANVIILSHWHQDHYESALRNNAYLNHAWIVPIQPVGPTNFKFAYNIAQSHWGSLYLWSNKPRTSLYNISIICCNGKSKNNSGLAIIVKINTRNSYKEILLSGDSAYKYINYGKRNFYGIVASHHGGTIECSSIIPISNSVGRIVYSFGQNNTYEHPNKSIVRKHEIGKWLRRNDTVFGNAGFIDKSVVKSISYNNCCNDLIIVNGF